MAPRVAIFSIVDPLTHKIFFDFDAQAHTTEQERELVYPI